MTENIIIAFITAIVTLTGGYYATRQQRQKDADNAEIETQKLKADLERELWERLHEDLQKVVNDLEAETEKREALAAKMDVQKKAHQSEMSSLKREYEGKINALTNRMRELEKLLNDKDEKIQRLEAENGKLKQDKGGKMGL